MEGNQTILAQVKRRVHDIDPKAKIFLFGSRARDNNREDSDWDFLILTEKPVTQDLKNKITDQLFQTELDTGQVLISIVQNAATWKKYSNTPVYKNITKDGIEI